MQHRQSVKRALASRTLSIGSWLSFPSLEIAEMMATSGFDWLVVDMEHTAIGTAEMARLIQVIDLAGCAPLVRVGANDPLLIKRAMDCGAVGVVVPMVSTVEEAQAAVAAIAYPPLGRRGVGLYRAQDFGRDFPSYRQWAGESSVLVVQIEHHRAVDNIKEILAVEGVDGWLIGPYDVSGSHGVPGQFDHPDVVHSMARLRDAVHSEPKAAGIHVVEPDAAALRTRVEDGYRFIAYGTDMLFMGAMLRQQREALAGARGVVAAGQGQA